MKICTVCGIAFSCPPSDKTVTCSKDCSKIHRSRVQTGVPRPWSDECRKRIKWNPENLSRGTIAAQSSPKAGHFETNTGAKWWHLVSPEGKHYYFRNLTLWSEQNYHLFGFDNLSDSSKVRGGITAAKRGAEGKIETCTYKDWRVLPIKTTSSIKRQKYKKQVEKDLSTLTERQRKILLMMVDDITMDEISNAMGCSPSSIRSSLQLIVRKLNNNIAQPQNIKKKSNQKRRGVISRRSYP